eukprot:tig00020603_g11770.t1
MLLCAFIIFSMQAGFALLEVGAVRSKNARNIMMRACFDACAGALAWWATGYAFAGPWPDDVAATQTTNGFIGNTFFFTSRDFTNWKNWFFQFTFAATGSTIINGAMTERTTFGAYLIYTGVTTGWIYPVVAHWMWSCPGWLGSKCIGLYGSRFGDPMGVVGALDFAGAGVVHMVGGFASLMGAIIVGPRIGRFDASGRAVEIPGHSSILQALGALLLWFGFYAFNCGSTLFMSAGMDAVAARVAVTTTLSGAAAGLVCLGMQKWLTNTWDLNGLTNGFLVGCVAITSPAAFIQPWAAVCTGIMAALAYLGMSRLVARMRIDDPIDAFSVHGVGGMIGLISTGVFAVPQYVNAVTGQPNVWGWGFVYSGGGGVQLGMQLLAIVVIAAWASANAALLFLLLKYLPFCSLRVPIEVEMMGIDVSKHGGSAYPEFKSLVIADSSIRKSTPDTSVTMGRGADGGFAVGGSRRGPGGLNGLGQPMVVIDSQGGVVASSSTGPIKAAHHQV